jgi:hypothetical protein
VNIWLTGLVVTNALATLWLVLQVFQSGIVNLRTKASNEPTSKLPGRHRLKA